MVFLVLSVITLGLPNPTGMKSYLGYYLTCGLCFKEKEEDDLDHPLLEYNFNKGEQLKRKGSQNVDNKSIHSFHEDIHFDHSNRKYKQVGISTRKTLLENNKSLAEALNKMIKRESVESGDKPMPEMSEKLQNKLMPDGMKTPLRSMNRVSKGSLFGSNRNLLRSGTYNEQLLPGLSGNDDHDRKSHDGAFPRELNKKDQAEANVFFLIWLKKIGAC